MGTPGLVKVLRFWGVSLAAAGVTIFRQAEIQNFRAAVGREQHVFRLQIAMADAGFVGRRQGFGDLGSHIHHLQHGELAFLERRAKSFALHQLGDHPAVADIVDADDPGVVERRDGAGFLLETLPAGRIGAVFRREQLHRHFAI